MAYSLSGGNFDSKNFSIKQGVAGHVMQLWTIFKMKLEDFLVMIGLKLLVMACLENTLRYTTPLWKFWKMCNDPGLNLLELFTSSFCSIRFFDRNHLLSEYTQWNYASFNVKISRLTSISFNKIIKLPKYFICVHSSHVIPLIETIPYLSHARSRNFASLHHTFGSRQLRAKILPNSWV